MQALKLIGFVSILACSGNLDVGKDEAGGEAGRNGQAGGGVGGSYNEPTAGSSYDNGGRAPDGGSPPGAGAGSIGGSNYEPRGGYGPGGHAPVAGYEQGGYLQSAGFNSGGRNGCFFGTGTAGGHAVGGANAGGAGSYDPCAPPPPPPDWPGSCDDCEPVAVSGTWEGYEEDFFLTPTERWSVTIVGARDGELSGTVTVGEGEIEPATDPAELYPPSNTGSYVLQSGATYTIVKGAARDAIVRFQIAAVEIMQSWCALQDSYQLGNGYISLPSVDWWSPDNVTCQMRDIDGTIQSFPIQQCSQAYNCACDESACAAKMEGLVTFDLHFDAEAGTLTGTTTDGRSLRLERADAK